MEAVFDSLNAGVVDQKPAPLAQNANILIELVVGAICNILGQTSSIFGIKSFGADGAGVGKVHALAVRDLSHNACSIALNVAGNTRLASVGAVYIY